MRALRIFLENSNLRIEFLYFAIFAVALILLILFLARTVKLFYPKFSYGLISTTIWAILIIYSYTLDFLKVSPLIYFLLLLAMIVGFVAFSIKKFSYKQVFSILDTKYLLKLFVSWCIAMALMMGPLMCIFPKGTIIPAPYITSDSVVHSLLASGTQYTEQVGLNKYWSEEYPRGFHSLIYYSNSILNIDVRILLFPMVALAYSFMIFFVEDLTRSKKYLKGLGKLLVFLLPFASYLITFTSYALFVSQVAVIPLLLLSLNVLFKKFSGFEKISLFAILGLAVANVYGIFAVNVLGIGFIVLMTYELYVRYKSKVYLKKELTENIKKFSKNYWIAILVSALLSIPSLIMFFKVTISVFINSGITFSGEGNLYNGYLSPFHLTGLWYPGLEYREEITTYTASLLMIVLLIQIFLIIRVKFSRNIYILNGILTFTILIALFGFHNVYIHFKYLTYFIPLFLITFGLATIKFFDQFRFKFISSLILIVFIIASVLTTTISLNKVTAGTDESFKTLVDLKEKYADKGSVMILSEEAWFQYYLKDNYDDYLPLKNYAFPAREYVDQELDYIFVDNFYNIDLTISAYLRKHPEVKALMDRTPGECKDGRERFVIYNLKCK